MSASILQRGAGQRGRHGAPGAKTGRGDGGRQGEEKPKHRARAGREAPRGRPPDRGEAGASPGCFKARGARCDYSPATERKRSRSGCPPERGPAGRGRGREARQGEGGRPRTPAAKEAAALSHSHRAGEAWAGPAPSTRRGGRERGPGGSAPPHRGAHGGRGLHLPAGSHRPRAAEPRSLQQRPPPPRTEPETLLLPPARGSQPLLTGGRPPPPPPQVSRVRVAPRAAAGRREREPPRPPRGRLRAKWRREPETDTQERGRRASAAGHAPFRARPAHARPPGPGKRLASSPLRSLGEVAAPVVRRAARGAPREL